MAPPRDTAVILACDAGYVPYALCLLDGLARLHLRRDFDLCLFTDAVVVPPPGLAIPDLRVIAPRGDNPFLSVPLFSRHGTATYLRLLVASHVAGLYRRVLYLDSDILPLQPGGIDGLLGADLHGAVLGAVRDNQQWRTPSRHVEEFRRAGLPAAPYFNAGLLLIDVERFEADRILDRSVELMRSRPDLMPRHDQSLLNLVLHRAWTELSPVWNWQHSRSSRFMIPLAEPRLVHFIGPCKPWADEAAQLPASWRRVFRDFQRRCYPDRPGLVTADPDRAAWPDKLAGTFLKHA
ncbi:MAG TPA: glycosyltransferase family 8 protein, partial [Rubellimicrobium sp.]|nr:glycosyltransferase family 8 protein [Rubellimicrobium sp.]